MRLLERGLSGAALFLIRLYRAAVSPYLGAHCRFDPSCSRYTEVAIQTHGVARGMLLGARRVLRCHPFHPGGVDPVPEADEARSAAAARADRPWSHPSPRN